MSHIFKVGDRVLPNYLSSPATVIAETTDGRVVVTYDTVMINGDKVQRVLERSSLTLIPRPTCVERWIVTTDKWMVPCTDEQEAMHRANDTGASTYFGILHVDSNGRATWRHLSDAL